MKRVILSAFFIIIFLPQVINTKTLWRDRNIYSSGSSLNVGDIIIVNIEDISRLRFSITFNNDNSYNIVSNPDSNITPFLPNVSSDKKATSSNNTDFSGRGNLQISLASRVAAVRGDGKLSIAGVREYSLNGKVNRFIISGIVDPELIKGRTVFSKDIAEFRLEVRGLQEAGPVTVERPAPGEGETASATMNEVEKQRIILDYLNNMLRELNR